MKGLKNILDFYINSSVHLALAVVSLSLMSFLEFNIKIDKNLLYFIFFGSISAYNFVKYAGIAKLHHASLARNLKVIQIFSFFCFLGLVYFTFQQDFETLIVSGILGLFTLLYAIPFGRNRRNLRNIGGIKIFIIALVWAGVVVILPLLNVVSLKEISFTFLQRFFFVIAITLPFEIRDLKFDSGQLNTIPQQIGIVNTKKIGYILLGIMLLLEFLMPFSSVVNFTALGLTLLVSAYFIKAAEVNQGAYYSAFWVEGIPVFWLICWVFTKILF
ncbi:hypothetical protein APR41_09025 [Salegentibacter salinarum]|uniref:Prenyltransferase n=1 Tax=Salegentibacter salinarum TaxID=447422 RepID=A0A2N0TP43_9FLAO|nr:hypothetical protein [Salegentibacter salinarum]PKD16476.1 hypothetical protein APR41_09025 [Salegentibacter salinarum]SKB64694.1 hypothetical protein SAMN05660903_01840 [Salegentibacter salinarum]